MNPLKMLSRGGAVSEPSDADFENVTLLLHGDGTNGAQNNTFLDSSTNNFTITRNGNTTQGTFSPFSKVNGRWSVFFNSANYTNIYAASSADFNFGSGDFTIECFFNSSNAMSAAAFWRLFDTGQLTCFFFSGNIYLRNAATSELVTVVAHGLSVGIWYHLAIVRSGTTYSIYRNGVLLTSGTGGTITSASAPFVIGTNSTYSQPLSGYVSNFRVTTGQALYTTTFTPTTTPLTTTSQGATASNVKLLTCQSNRFVDNSTQNTKTILFGDNSGNPGTRFIQPFSPFPTLTAYDAATNGGSGYFDGSGDYLSTSSAVSTLNFGTGAFTVEAWLYQNARSGTQWIIGGGGGFQLAINSSGFIFGSAAGVGDMTAATTAVPLSAWTHIVIVRSSTSSGGVAYYINGVAAGTATSSTNFFLDLTLNVGTTNGNVGVSPFNGYISNLRVVKSAVYTTGFTPPTAPLTAISNTSLLCNFTNAGIIDHSMSNNLETVGNAQIDTTTKKYGTGAMKFDGTGDYLVSPNLYGQFDFRTGDFTIELWLYSTTGFANFSDAVLSKGPVGAADTRSWDLRGSGTGGNLEFLGPNSTSYFVTTSTPWTTGWAHIAICRSGSNTRLFVNGTQQGATYTTLQDFAAGGQLVVATGYFDPPGRTSTCFIDDLRITKGKARYTSNFTPPTAAFEDIGE